MSRRLKQLLSRLNFLENNILPSERIDGNYTKKEQDLIRSFILLSHAEIEAYLEDIVKDKITKSLNSWNSSRAKSHCIKSVMTFVGADISYENDINSNNLQYRINKTITHYQRAMVDKNHGIKEKNILKILLPLGIELNELDQTWLSVMDSFGSTRGLIAHNSFTVTQTIDRNTELNKIKNLIIPELTNIDKMISKLK